MSMRRRKPRRRNGAEAEVESVAVHAQQTAAEHDGARAERTVDSTPVMSTDAASDHGDGAVVPEQDDIAEQSPTEAAPVAEALAAARARAQHGDVQGAIEAYRAFIATAESSATSRIELARLYEGRAEWLLALEQYEAAREEEDLLDATLGIAVASAALGRFETTERELRRALKSHPANARVFATSGMIDFRRGHYAQAEQDLRRAIELDPEHAHAYFYRGEALNQLNRVDEALEMLEQATQRLPDLSRGYYVMGILFDKKGRSQEAAAMYRKAREVAAA